LPGIFTYLDARIPVRCHEHMAILERGGASAAWGAEFVSEGLARGHWCCCVAPADLHPGMVARLRQLGVEVEQHLDNQRLQFPPQAMDAGDLLERGRRFFGEAETARAPAVRWLEAGMGAKPPGIPVPQFFELHARWNYLVKQYPSVALCVYDVEQMEIPHVFSAIAVHRHLLVEGMLVRDNPFYLPAEKFIALSPEDREQGLRDVFREVGFDLGKLLATLAGYGQLQRPAPPG
jgi:hypothetical protein